MPWYKLLRKDAEFSLSDDHLKNFETIKKDFLQATTTALRLAKPGQHCVILCDQVFTVADLFS